jgi:hypothetical protein
MNWKCAGWLLGGAYFAIAAGGGESILVGFMAAWCGWFARDALRSAT